MIQKQALQKFIKGLRIDFDEHAESSESYIDGVNGRLFSLNGTLSYASIEGTAEIYQNNNIVKYLGFGAFRDELILLVKVLPTIDNVIVDPIETEEVTTLITNPFVVTVPFPDTNVDFELLIESNTTEIITEVIIPPVEIPDDLDFSDDYNCGNLTSDETIDYSIYYNELLNTDNFENCSILDLTGDLKNNKHYLDAFYSLKYDESGNIFSNLLWSGKLNWDINAKIVTMTLFENNYYKRVYFTDYQNPFRVINVKDGNLENRSSLEFNALQNTALLQPEIKSIGLDGQIKSGSVLYMYRLITANGQSTEFSPASKIVRIVLNDDDIDYSGGNISEVTNKSVTIQCNIIDYAYFNEIEAVVVEYEAENAPTAIRSLGIKPVSEVNEFTHFGNEGEYADLLTITELLDRKNNWKYCSGLSEILPPL